MVVYFWIFVNFLVVSGTSIYIWVLNPVDSAVVALGQLFSQLAIILFIININMYFIFLVIRKSKQRSMKISLAKISRKMMKSHRLLGITGAIMIVFHVTIMVTKLGSVIGLSSGKFIAGYVSVSFLISTLFAGYLRHKKASKFRRKFHLFSALSFGIAFLVHIFYP